MKEVSPAFVDRSYDVLRARPSSLAGFFDPVTVAVIGATERGGSVGRTVLDNLLRSPRGGFVFPVNPKHSSLLGLKAYASILDIKEAVDLALIATPAKTVPDLVGECVHAGVKCAVILSAGFKETGTEGAELERLVMAKAKPARMRVIGPNCLGVMNPWSGLNATFARTMARPGSVALVSQSGALVTAILDWSLRENVGFSSVVSLGSMIDVGWADTIDYLGDDPRTESIVLYMESIGDARAFISAAREVALSKPIIVIKAGRTEAAAKAAASHTGALAGSGEVLEAAFRRCGILVADRLSDLFHLTDALSKQRRPMGPRLCIVTNAGGPGVLAADALIEGGGRLAELSTGTREALSGLLPEAWSRGNPVDVLGDADPERFARAVEFAAKDPDNDAVLAILTPQAMTDPEETARRVAVLAGTGHKPLFASWMGGTGMQGARDILSRAGLPCFDFPDTACRIFADLSAYSSNIEALYQTPDFFEDSYVPRRQAVQELLEKAREHGRTLLTEFESKAILEAYGIPTVPTKPAQSADEAVQRASELGYPVVLKLNSRTITHKTDAGGVKLGLENEAAVRKAFNEIGESVTRLKGGEHFQGVTVQPMVAAGGYEIILGSSLDPQVGPVLLFGSGGLLVEVYRDHALALPPLNTTLARRMMERTRIYSALKGIRGRRPVDLRGLERLLVKFSRLVIEQPLIKELDINPLLASPDGLLALDARVLLQDPSIPSSGLPRPAIRPYPNHSVEPWTSMEGVLVVLRPIRPEDEPRLVQFHRELSSRSIRLGYSRDLDFDERTAHQRLLRICFADYDRDIVLVAETAGAGGDKEIVGVGRLNRSKFSPEAEFSMIVVDRWQKKGLGAHLLESLLKAAKGERISAIAAHMLPENRPMRALCRRCGFEEEWNNGEEFITARLRL
ncbi:MAG TPA: bifunctional acetate--CoA ligase family protein/GNAT family N-acetyltransferase [bacterium]|jgi:acetyltransferase|nr:bifunctional acetate--CoA ligase family protein/GNAT family N-acetyltransferase [bacterium]